MQCKLTTVLAMLKRAQAKFQNQSRYLPTGSLVMLSGMVMLAMLTGSSAHGSPGTDCIQPFRAAEVRTIADKGWLYCHQQEFKLKFRLNADGPAKASW